MTNGEEKTDEEEVKGGGKKKFVIIIILAIVLAAAGGAAFMFLGGGGDENSKSSESSETQSAKDEQDPPKETEDGEGANSAQEGGEAQPEEEGAASGIAHPLARKKKERKNIGFGETYTFKPFHLNLGNPLENRYIRLEVALEYLGGDDQKEEIEARVPQLRDAVISVTSRKTREFLLSPDGKDRLRLEILNQINQYMSKKIERVFISDMLIE